MLLFSAFQVRWRHLLVTACIAGLLVQSATWYRQRKLGFTFDFEDSDFVEDYSPEEEYLERLTDIYGLTNFTKWQAWRITSKEQSLDIGPMTDVHANFQPSPEMAKMIDVKKSNASELRATKKMELPCRSNPTQTTKPGSKFLFGVSTSYERIAHNDWAILRAWQRWLTDKDGSSNGAGMVLMLNSASSAQLDAVDTMLHEAGIEAYVTSTDEPTSKARRYYELVRVLKTYAATLAATRQSKHWFGVVEDTVFFPSLTYLAERLSSYSPNEQLYIGIPSARSDWKQAGEYITTYGGGAIFLSRHVVSLIPKLPCLENDIPASSYQAQNWDVVLRDCVREKADISMHVIPAFYSPHDSDYRPQLASHETGVRPLLLRDYQERHRLDVAMAHLVTNICGETCFMHQYLFHDNWAIINGVSISYHPGGLSHYRHHRHHNHDDHDDNHSRDPNRNHNHQHKTLSDKNVSGEPDTSDVAAKTLVSDQLIINQDKVDQMPLEWTGSREVWKLVDSVEVADGSVWQAYLKRGVRSAAGQSEKQKQNKDQGSVLKPAEEELDSVIVLIWENKRKEPVRRK
ncbi:hypothetical protein E4U21_007183 [Claviceps maximensis]|nr:hypothetical protein E4U21_007183 [Claviceps maximensis]